MPQKKKGVYAQVLEYQDEHCGPSCPAFKRSSCRGEYGETIECMVGTSGRGLSADEYEAEVERMKEAYRSGRYYYKYKTPKNSPVVTRATPGLAHVYAMQHRIWSRR